MPVYDPLDSDVQPSFEQLSKLKKQNKLEIRIDLSAKVQLTIL